MTVTHRAALAFLAAAAVWPTAMGWLANALMSPIDRAAREAWCGVPYHAASEFLGHCAACWTGAALLAAIGLGLIIAAPRSPVRAHG